MASGRRDLRVIPGGRADRRLHPTGASEPDGLGRRVPEQGARTEDLHELYTRHGGSVYGRCYYLLKERSKAEDAMQDVFAKALDHAGGFRGESSPATWLMTIATNHCLNLIRSERAPWHARFAVEEAGRVSRSALDGGGAGPRLFENREAVRHLLGRVDPETQAAAIHYYVDEMTLEEVAAALGRSIPTVRKRLEAFAALSHEPEAKDQDDGKGTSP
jgi:RNA polymerase sigma-70 factor (ECF subfamily)